MRKIPREYIVSGRRRVAGGHGPIGSSVFWVDSMSVTYTEGISLARHYESEKDAIRALEAAQRMYKGINWQVERVSYAYLVENYNESV